jgi:hypothetical protein
MKRSADQPPSGQAPTKRPPARRVGVAAEDVVAAPRVAPEQAEGEAVDHAVVLHALDPEPAGQGRAVERVLRRPDLGVELLDALEPDVAGGAIVSLYSKPNAQALLPS